MELRRIRGDLIQVFRIVHGLDNLNFDDFLSYQIIPEPEAIVFKLSKQYSRLGVVQRVKMNGMTTLIRWFVPLVLMPSRMVTVLISILRTVGVFKLST